MQPNCCTNENNIDESAPYWLALGRIDGLGVHGVHSLVRSFGFPGAVYAASLTELESCGLPPKIARDIHTQKGLAEAHKEIGEVEKRGFRVFGFSSADYPPLLRQISDPPLSLQVNGDAAALLGPAIAIVGARRPSAYGSSVAHRLSGDLAPRGIVVVSGMARGIDSAAHRGALESGGKTVAVLGCGLDVVYPRENRKLMERIAGQGAVISEFPLGAPPVPENFPIRNRVISGLSLGTIIVEAAEYSGSLITARLALEQNREVFAVPGNITSPQSFGPNLLIKQGAKLVDHWQDVVDELPSAVRMQLLPQLAAPGESSEQRPLMTAMDPDQKAVYDSLRADEASFVDAICAAVSISQPRVLTALLGLEMNGLIRQLPGKNFVRVL